ncbi:MAG: hypothetical protein JWM27_3316, partial [Gemmatimonadetes bacterium]|nr:hypothetical protein [Gemmatimonadota bacterium]
MRRLAPAPSALPARRPAAPVL